MEDTNDTAMPSAGPETASSPSYDGPHSWPNEMRGHWGALPQDLRTFIHGRETSMHKKFSEDGERLKGYAPLDSMFEKWGSHLDGWGHQKDRYAGIEGLLFAQAALMADPQRAIAQLMQDAGLDASGFLSPQVRQQMDQWQASAGQLQGAQQQIAELQAEISRMKEGQRAETEKRVTHARQAKVAASLNVRSSPISRGAHKTVDETLREIAYRDAS